MICPHCRAETSDMMNVCELCGQPLSGTPEQTIAEPPPGDATIGTYQSPDEMPPSEWPPPAKVREGRKSGTGQRWYLSPWPYLIGIALVAAVVAALLLAHSSVKAYPELVVNNQPTLLDFYTDT